MMNGGVPRAFGARGASTEYLPHIDSLNSAAPPFAYADVTSVGKRLSFSRLSHQGSIGRYYFQCPGVHFHPLGVSLQCPGTQAAPGKGPLSQGAFYFKCTT